MYKKLNDFHKKFAKLKNVSPQTKTIENLKEKFWTMLEIFSMNYIKFTKINTMKK